MDLVMSVCDRIVVLNFGQVIASGTPDAIRANPEVASAYLGDEVHDRGTAGHPEEATVLEVRDLSVSFGAVQALRSVSFDAEPGAITAVLGANGAGKTTLLRTISGLVKPRDGSVRFDGDPLLGHTVESIARMGVAHVPEGRGVIEELTVEENLRLATLWCLRKQQRQAAIDETLELFPRLRGFRRRHASTLSGGERQMLVLGRALISRPAAPPARRAEPGAGAAGHRPVDGVATRPDRRHGPHGGPGRAERPQRPVGVAPRRDPQPRPGRRLRRRRHGGRPTTRCATTTWVSDAMSLFFDYTLDGIANGMIYATLALALVLIYRATRIINFAQGAAGMLTTFIAFSLLSRGVGYWWAFVLVLVIGFAIGAACERVLIRPLHGKSELNPVIVTIGLLVVFEGLAGAIYGNASRGFPAAFSQSGLKVGAHDRSPSRTSTSSSSSPSSR